MSKKPENAGKPWGPVKEKLREDFNNVINSDESLAEKYKRNLGGIKGQRWVYGNELRNQGLSDAIVVSKCHYTIEQLDDPNGQYGWSDHGYSIIDKVTKQKAKAKAKKDVTTPVDRLMEDEDEFDDNTSKIKPSAVISAKGQMVHDDLESLDVNEEGTIAPPPPKPKLKPIPQPTPPNQTTNIDNRQLLIEMRLQTLELRKISASIAELVELTRFQ